MEIRTTYRIWRADLHIFDAVFIPIIKLEIGNISKLLRQFHYNTCKEVNTVQWLGQLTQPLIKYSALQAKVRRGVIISLYITKFANRRSRCHIITPLIIEKKKSFNHKQKSIWIKCGETICNNLYLKLGRSVWTMVSNKKLARSNLSWVDHQMWICYTTNLKT